MNPRTIARAIRIIRKANNASTPKPKPPSCFDGFKIKMSVTKGTKCHTL